MHYNLLKSGWGFFSSLRTGVSSLAGISSTSPRFVVVSEKQKVIIDVCPLKSEYTQSRIKIVILSVNESLVLSASWSQSLKR